MIIKVLTMHCVYNYGSALQTLATQQILSDLGHNVEFIDYRRPSNSDSYILNHGLDNASPLSRLLRKARRFPSVMRQSRIFSRFLKENINLTQDTYFSSDQLVENPPEADVYCAGSDQIWNSSWNQGFIPAYFLKFGNASTRRISFSSSIGKTSLEDWEKPLFKEALSDFASITVREASAVQLLDGIGIKSKHTLDPTLAISPDFWNEFSSPRMIADDYVLIYQLNKNKEFDDFAKRFSRNKKLKLVRICYWFDHALLPGKGIVVPSVEEFVSLFKHASYIITDSFHGTAFSLNLSKEIICIYPNDFSTRLDSLLHITGAQSRHLTDYHDLSIAEQPLDFHKIANIFDVQRKDTISILQNAIENGKMYD